MADSDSIKLCECGCGKPAPIAKRTNNKFGHVRGEPVRFYRGHNIRLDERSRYASHGMRDTPTYRSWMAMNRRCNNPNTKDYPNYGGRGIRVCAEWKSFEIFLADMGERPIGTTLDRYPNNDGDYEPDNTRWASKRAQGLNKRTSASLTYNGETLTVAEWADRIGKSRKFIENRVRAGWSIEDIFTRPRYARQSGNDLKEVKQ
jgi:hypothetical protein